MITGIGVDIVDIRRIDQIWRKFGNRFLFRVFTDTEILDANKYQCHKLQVNHFAKRFAAKEAIVKAMGTGFGKEISMRDIVISNHKNGKPSASILNIKDYILHLSISDDGNWATAFAILESSKHLQ